MKTLKICLLGMVIFACNKESVDTDLSTNPEDCQLQTIHYGSATSNSTDQFSYDSNGNVTKIVRSDAGTVYETVSMTYSGGVLTSSKSSLGDEIKYTYNGTDPAKATLINKSGTVDGELVFTLDAQKRISKMLVQNATGIYQIYNGVQSTFVFDATGNYQYIEIKAPNGFVISMTEMSDHVPVRSHYTSLKGMVLDPVYSPIQHLQNAPVWGFPKVSSFQKLKISEYVSATGTPLSTPNVTTDITYKRIGNESGMQNERSIVGGSTNYFIYTGCK